MASAPSGYAAIAARAAAAAQVFVDDPGHPVLSEEDAHHLGRVLRLRDGEEVIAADGRGGWARTTWRGGVLEPRCAGAGDGPGADGTVQFEARAEPPLTVAFAPVKGEIPSPLAPPPGCHFHPRCPHAMDRCRREAPVLREIGPGRRSACHLNERVI